MMDMAVFDTNILIDFSRQHPEAQAIMRRVTHRMISIVTWVEFLTGIPAPQMDTAKAFLEDTFEVVETERSTYEKALELRCSLRLKLPDALIYATAQTLKLPLITRDVKDFNPDWDGVYNPY